MLEKIAYLRGLIEGMDLDKNKKESKIYAAIIDALEEMAYTVEEYSLDTEDLFEVVDLIDEDLEAIEDELVSMEERDSHHHHRGHHHHHHDRDDCECGCGHDHDRYSDIDLDEDLDPAEILYEVVCPLCGHETIIDEDTLLSGTADCEGCGEPLEFSIDDLMYGSEDFDDDDELDIELTGEESSDDED